MVVMVSVGRDVAQRDQLCRLAAFVGETCQEPASPCLPVLAP